MQKIIRKTNNKMMIICLIAMMISYTSFDNKTFAASFNSLRIGNNFYSEDEQVNVNIYEKINPTIVSIEAEIDLGTTSSGSGCIIDQSGVILTSSHVVDGAKDIEVILSSGKVYKAKVLYTKGLENDLALLKIEANKKLPSIEFGDSSLVKVGQKILAIGNPFGFNGTLTTGIVSRIDYKRNKIQTDAAINPGSSGGPLLNTKGQVIGISQSIYNPDNNKSNIGIGFAIPVNFAKDFINLAKFEKKF